tara:strand:- start:63 stop:437 length:375 start_codon:yes stop_codon:yes gene_type:complete
MLQEDRTDIKTNTEAKAETDKNMATKISEDTNVQLDLKTIGMIVAGTVSLAGMWFSLQEDMQDLHNKIDSFSGDEFVQKMEFQLKDELIRNNVIQIDNATKNLKEDIEENKESIKDLENKVFKR